MKIITLFKVIKKYIRNYIYSKIASNKKITKNKIILWSYRGREYSCNPKYITEYILKNKIDFQIVWAFENPEKFLFLQNRGIKLVKYFSKDFFKELMTAHIIITNTRFGIDFHKRKNQIYIQTWHGTMALKAIEKDAQNFLKKFYILNAKNDSKKIDYILSGCKMNSNIIKNSFWYNGKILEIGNPRNDLFFERNLNKEKILKKLKLEQRKVVLYAPTFRRDENIDAYNIDFDILLESLNRKFANNYVVLTRLHPNLKGKKLFNKISNNIIDVTKYDDMQELLVASDILITDFSSSIFDFLIMKKICLLYVSDLDEYLKKERRLYFDIKKELPFPIATNNEELKNVILDFDSELYKENIENFSKKLGIIENGNASKNIVELMLQL